jgi:glycosyltransferase involved in cell wall biosynthesis
MRNNDANSVRPTRVAYVMTWFPKLSETFVLYEMLAVQREGIDVQVYPLRKGPTDVMHHEAREVVARAHYTPWFSVAILWANLLTLLRHPLKYFGTLATAIRENFGSRRYLSGALMYFPKAVYLARHMVHHHVDHIHAHFASHPALVAYVIHRLTGIPYSFTAHGSDLHRDQHMLREKVRRAATTVTISEFNRRVIHQVCGDPPPSNVRVIHCGVDTQVFSSIPDKHQRPGTHVPAIYCIGTMHEVKGQTYLLRAARLLVDQEVPCVIRFIGDGPDLVKCQALAQELKISDRVEFLGHQPRDAVQDHLQHADIVAVPSVPTQDGRREGIPVALMEAMASGAAVVASRLSGIPELVRHDVNGLLVTPGDVRELAVELRQLLQDEKLRDRLAVAARQTIEQEFNQQLSAAQLAEVFVAASGRGKVDQHAKASVGASGVKEMETCA